MSKRCFWSDEEKKVVRKLHGLYQKGKIEIEDFTRVLTGRTESAVRNILNEMKLPIERAGSINYEELKRLSKITKGV